MPNMNEVIVVGDQFIHSGNKADSYAESIFGTPGSFGKTRGYYECNITLHCAYTRGGMLYVAAGGGRIEANHKSGDTRPQWTPFLWTWPVEFFAWWDIGVEGAQHYQGQYPDMSTHIMAATIFGGCDSSGTNQPGAADGDVWYDIHDYGASYVGEDITQHAGFVQVSYNMPIWEAGQKEHHLSVWISGAVSYGAPNQDPIYLPSQEFVFTSFDVPVDYYPWARFNGVGWDSLNRDGAEQDATGLHRFVNEWNRVTNSANEGSGENHGFRYDGSQFVKSPEYM